MDTLAERLDRIHLKVRVPGMEIYGELRNRREISVSFGEDTYQWMKESRLEQALATLGRLLTANWSQEYGDAVRAAGLDPVPPPEVRNNAYERARDELAATGASADGRVTISAVNLRDFTVRITRGTIREVRERAFLASLNEAVAAFVTDHLAKIRELQDQHLS